MRLLLLLVVAKKTDPLLQKYGALLGKDKALLVIMFGHVDSKLGKYLLPTQNMTHSYNT